MYTVQALALGCQKGFGVVLVILDPVQAVEGENLVETSRKDLARLDCVHQVHLLEQEPRIVQFVIQLGVMNHIF